MSAPPTEPEKADPEADSTNISHLDLYQLVELFIMLLAEQTWRHLGLLVNPRTRETKKDAAKAHLAIDCIISLVDKVEPHLESKEKNRLRNLITELQLKYVQQIK